jgi:tetratricopeptide (TPR) repeat protein
VFGTALAVASKNGIFMMLSHWHAQITADLAPLSSRVAAPIAQQQGYRLLIEAIKKREAALAGSRVAELHRWANQRLLGAAREVNRSRLAEALDHFVAARLALLECDAREAEAALDCALQIGHSSGERVAAFYLWRGRARDALGRRDEARDDDRRAADGDENVRRAAHAGLRRACKPRRFGIELTLADVPIP